MRTLLIGSGINQVKSVEGICTAIDISQEYLDKAKEFKPENTYIKADVQDMPFSNNTFDKVIFTHVLEHIKYPKKALSEIRRVLKKGGELYLEVPTKERELLLSKNNLVYKRDVYNGFHKTHYNKKLLLSQLTEFSKIEFEQINNNDIIFWYLWGKIISLFNLKNKFYIEECGQIHSIKYDKTTRQLSRLIYIFNIILSPFIFNKVSCEYHVRAIK